MPGSLAWNHDATANGRGSKLSPTLGLLRLDGGKVDGHRPAGSVPLGNGEDAESDAWDTAQLGGGIGAEAGC